jgi:alpha/beta superfamily hydrolase
MQAQIGGTTRAACIGWSFGAIVALCASSRPEASVESYVGIAPPVSVGAELAMPSIPDEFEGETRRMIVCGDQDSFSRPDDVHRLASHIGATVNVVPGAGHFFEERQRELCVLVVEFATRS